MKLVRRNPGIRVGAAATELRLAANTVSTLVSSLTASGWLRRTSNSSDARSTQLQLTPKASAKMAAWRDRRVQSVSTALATLESADRDALTRAMPALRRLVERIEAEP